MIDNKESEIILCKGIELDKNHENVLSYNESDMVTLCRNHSIYTANKYSLLGNTDYLDISCSYAISMYANYVAFKNPTFGNKWIFAFVTDVKLLNPTTTRIFFQVDVWATWYSRFILNQAFIEREHVSDDTIGKHTIPENLETGEYIAQIKNNTSLNPVLNNMYYLSNNVIIAGVTKIGFNIATPQSAQQSKYNGIFSGLTYLAFKTSHDLQNYIYSVQQLLSEDNIACLFIAPLSLTGIETSSEWLTIDTSYGVAYQFEMAFVHTSDFEKDMGEVNYPKANHLDNDYVPVNNKLLTWPYCFLNITNNAGQVTDYHYEDFNSSNWCNFEIRGAIGVGCSIKMFPKDYCVKGTSSNTLENKLHAIDGGKLPTCGWLNDAYTNWLTSNSVNIGLSLAKSVTSVGVGVATGGVGAFIGGFSSIAGTIASVYEHSLQPPISKGGINQGDLNFAQRNTFNTYPMTIKKEYAKIIDQYFSRFGYKVNEVKTPNLKSRTKFNFIKVGGMDELVHGDIPATDLEEINDIFRKGVTIFHNYNDIGNYTISNPIRS